MVNGLTFTSNSWLPDFTDKSKPIVYEVGNIVLLDETDIRTIYLIYKVYQNIFYEEHFVAYSVDLGKCKYTSHTFLHVHLSWIINKNGSKTFIFVSSPNMTTQLHTLWCFYNWTKRVLVWAYGTYVKNGAQTVTKLLKKNIFRILNWNFSLKRFG